MGLLSILELARGVGNKVRQAGGVKGVFAKGDGKLFNFKSKQPTTQTVTDKAATKGGFLSGLSGSIGFGKAQGNYVIPLLLGIAIALSLAFRGFIFGSGRKRRR